jgi:hypothetical protein
MARESCKQSVGTIRTPHHQGIAAAPPALLPTAARHFPSVPLLSTDWKLHNGL